MGEAIVAIQRGKAPGAEHVVLTGQKRSGQPRSLLSGAFTYMPFSFPEKPLELPNIIHLLVAGWGQGLLSLTLQSVPLLHLLIFGLF